MPFEIELENLPLGYCASSKRKEETEVSVIPSEFTSSEDGDLFISRLDGFPTEIINKLAPKTGIGCSSIDHLLIIIARDKKATVYVNELDFISMIQIKRPVEKGEAVFTDDIADFIEVRIKDVEIPKDAGFLLVFSKGWRKGLYYDFWPLQQEPVIRTNNLNLLLGELFSYLHFQDLFKISIEEWTKFFDQQWFPFIVLKSATIRKMLNSLRSDWSIDELLPDISEEILNSYEQILNRWENHFLLKSHFSILKQALIRYREGDYISSIAILYPRIEGIMRSFHFNINKDIRPNQGNLIKSVIRPENLTNFNFSLLLPDKFSRYLKEIFFADFDPTDPQALSRNTVAHGIAPADKFSLKEATIAILIIQQLLYYMKKQECE